MGLNISQAVEAMREGKKVSRGGWQPVHDPSFVVLIPGREIEVSYEPMVSHLGAGTRMNTADHIDAIFQPVPGTIGHLNNAPATCVVGWQLTQADVLHDDWFVVE